MYESKHERHIPASETESIVDCVVVQRAVGLQESFWQERVCILIDVFIPRHCPEDVIRPYFTTSLEKSETYQMFGTTTVPTQFVSIHATLR